jgi:Divergent CRAL/TRIO domain
VARKVDFDIIFDFTSFTARSRLPNVWLRFAVELLPLDVRRRWRAAYILNVNRDAQSFLSSMFYLFSGEVFRASSARGFK